jgi:hypothetical protein
MGGPMYQEITSSQADLNYWARWYARRAEKWATEPFFLTMPEETRFVHIMHDLFLSYMYRDEIPRRRVS